VLGDIVVTRPVPASTLQVGDVIRFDGGGVSIVHRIIGVHQTASGLVFQTQGDANNFVDAPVAASAIEGKVILRVPKLGLLPIKLKTLVQQVLS
jgi:signal peptidase I